MHNLVLFTKYVLVCVYICECIPFIRVCFNTYESVPYICLLVCSIIVCERESGRGIKLPAYLELVISRVILLEEYILFNLYQNLNLVCVRIKIAASHNNFTLLSCIIGKLHPGDPNIKRDREVYMNSSHNG